MRTMTNLSETISKLSKRDDEEITDLVVACLYKIQPTWLKVFQGDDEGLRQHVRDTLDDLELTVRRLAAASDDNYARASTGCMTVTYDEGSIIWDVTVGYRYDREEDDDE